MLQIGWIQNRYIGMEELMGAYGDFMKFAK